MFLLEAILILLVWESLQCLAFTSGTNLIVYLWTRLLPLLPSVSLCAKICQVKSPHTLKSRFTTCRSAEHYRWLTYQQTLPHGMLQTWQHNTLAKNIHKLTYNLITLWRRDCTRWHTKQWVDSFKERLVSLCAVPNKTDSSITISPITTAAIFVNIITDSSDQNKTPSTIKTPV